eukprot:TCALIF_04445-PA protein Name:"Protein of unknown function" AED:0.29 eAED:0.30 QI:0/0/0/0.16/1/1/6/0/546
MRPVVILVIVFGGAANTSIETEIMSGVLVTMSADAATMSNGPESKLSDYSEYVLPTTTIEIPLQGSFYDLYHLNTTTRPDLFLSLSSGLNMEPKVSTSTLKYLSARASGLTSMERKVFVMVDEIYVAQRAEFAHGNLSGIGENGSVPKTLVGYMVKSIAGKFKDMVALYPCTKLTAEMLEAQVNEVLRALDSIGFEILALCMDNATTNRKYFKKILCDGELKPFIQHPIDPNLKLFIFFDSVHNKKNAFNSFMNREQFICLPFHGVEIGSPNFRHIRDLYDKECGQDVKIAHKLTQKSLCPNSIEKTSVSHTEAIFHESTSAGLKFYNAKNPSWTDTAIRQAWNILNVKSKSLIKRARCEDCKTLLSKADQPLMDLDVSQTPDNEETMTKEKLLMQINRGGLCTPSELIFMLCLHLWLIFRLISSSAVKDKLVLSEKPWLVFGLVAFDLLNDTPDMETVFQHQCESGHQLQDHFRVAATKMLNIFLKNEAKMTNKIRGTKRGSNTTNKSRTNRKCSFKFQTFKDADDSQERDDGMWATVSQESFAG